MEVQYHQFYQLLLNGLERIQQVLVERKQEGMQESVRNTIDMINSEKGRNEVQVDVGKYFPILEKCLEMKISKVIETGLFIMQKLVSQKYVNGRQQDMEQIVKAISGCAYQADDYVQLQVIKCLIEIVISQECEVHGSSLVEIFQACFHIHIQTRNVMNQLKAKDALIQMLRVLLNRMEGDVRAQSVQDYYKYDEQQSFLKEEELSEISVYKTVSTLVKNMVDDVQLYQAKLSQYSNEVRYIPLRSVPYIMNPDDPCYKKLKVVYIKNEQNKTSGKFGWCIACRNTADFYCIETRDPICSKRCKELHIKSLQNADK